MEGKFNDNPDEDCGTDPVGQITAVRALSIIFRGVNVEETKLREQLSQGQMLEFRMVEIALFSTVVCCVVAHTTLLLLLQCRQHNPQPASRNLRYL